MAVGHRLGSAPRREKFSRSALREAAGVSQSEFARLIGVPVKTLQNWEQGRTQPTGPARALLKIVGADPKAAIRALHA